MSPYQLAQLTPLLRYPLLIVSKIDTFSDLSIVLQMCLSIPKEAEGSIDYLPSN